MKLEDVNRIVAPLNARILSDDKDYETVLDALRGAEEYFADNMDIKDGPNGPLPDDCMRLHGEVRAAISLVCRLRARATRARAEEAIK